MLDEGETLSCGCYSNSGHNFAIGTSFGKILIGMMKKDPMANTTKYNLFISRVSTVSKTTDNAVTSLQMTSFDPLGTLLAAFDDGKVRCWNSQVSAAVYEKKLQEQTNKRNRRRREAYDLADLGEVQFDVVDKFDMFENPHGNEELTEEDIAKNQELYGVSKTLLVRLKCCLLTLIYLFDAGQDLRELRGHVQQRRQPLSRDLLQLCVSLAVHLCAQLPPAVSPAARSFAPFPHDAQHDGVQ